MNKNRFEQLIFFCIFLVGISFGYYKYGLSNQLEKISETEGRVLKNVELLNSLNKVKENRKEIVSKVEKFKEELVVLNKLIPRNNNSTDFNFELYHELKKRGIKTKNLSTLKSNKLVDYEYDTISISFDSSKDKAFSFIKYLQDYPRKIKLKEVTVNIRSTEQVGVNLQIDIYSME